MTLTVTINLDDQRLTPHAVAQVLESASHKVKTLDMQREQLHYRGDHVGFLSINDDERFW